MSNRPHRRQALVTAAQIAPNDQGEYAATRVM